MPLFVRDLLLAGRRCLISSTSERSLEQTIADWLDVEKVCIVSSGRAALYAILRTLRAPDSRTEVVIPAYTCPSLALAVARAGLKVRLCDVTEDDGNLNPQKLDEAISSETLAVVPVHLNGVPCRIEEIVSQARRHGAFVVEDCAQSAGARWNHRLVGTFGEFAFFSLGRGKVFTTYEGGIAVSRSSNNGRLLGQEIASWKQEGLAEETIVLSKLIAMLIFFHPRLYWWVRRLPLGWEREMYSQGFHLGVPSAFRQEVGAVVFQRLAEVNAIREKNAQCLKERLACLGGLRVVDGRCEASPVYPWLTVLFDNSERREEAYRRLQAEGLGASSLYTRALNQYRYLEGIVPQADCPVAQSIASRILTLPTHPCVREKDLDRMAELLSEVAG